MPAAVRNADAIDEPVYASNTNENVMPLVAE